MESEIRKAFNENDLEVQKQYFLTGERVCAKSTYIGKDKKGYFKFAHHFRGMPLCWKTKNVDFTENGDVYIPEDAKVQRDFEFNKRNGLEEIK